MTSTIKVPDFMPVLSKGKHSDPARGACIMEYVSIIAGEDFTDHPQCVHPTLADSARAVNDTLPDEQRHLLIPLISRFIGTNKHPAWQEADLTNAFLRHLGRASYCFVGWSSSQTVTWLSEMLDIYDSITGRQCDDPPDGEIEAAGQLVAEAQADEWRRLGLRLVPPSVPVWIVDETHKWMYFGSSPAYSDLAKELVTW